MKGLDNENCDLNTHASYMLGHLGYSHTTSQLDQTIWQVPRLLPTKESISDNPKFSGLAKYGISFEQKFCLVASSQGFKYVLQDKKYEPVTENEWTNYKLDLTFIYDVIHNSWADSTQSYLVKQDRPTKNGQKVYLDAVNTSVVMLLRMQS